MTFFKFFVFVTVIFSGFLQAEQELQFDFRQTTLDFYNKQPYIVGGWDWRPAKQQLLAQAEEHKKKARKAAQWLKSGSSYLPNLESKQHLEALITSAVASCGASSPREKILMIGLSIVSSMVCESYNVHCYYKRMVCELTYHMEMDQFYSNASLEHAENELMDDGHGYMYYVIDYLTLSDLLTYCIDPDELQYYVSDKVCYERNLVFSCFEDRKLTRKISDICKMLNEQIRKRLFEHKNEYVNEQIDVNLDNAMNFLDAAEWYWKLN